MKTSLEPGIGFTVVRQSYSHTLDFPSIVHPPSALPQPIPSEEHQRDLERSCEGKIRPISARAPNPHLPAPHLQKKKNSLIVTALPTKLPTNVGPNPLKNAPYAPSLRAHFSALGSPPPPNLPSTIRPVPGRGG